MKVYDLNPLTRLHQLLTTWRTTNRKSLGEVPECVELSYAEFCYIWRKVQQDQYNYMDEREYHTPLKKDVKNNPERYKLFTMQVFIND